MRSCVVQKIGHQLKIERFLVTLAKILLYFLRRSRAAVFELVYFDAFSPDIQPELWSKEIFKKVFNSMRRGGVLTTYSTKGDVKRALKEVGFVIEKLPGPIGKREILRAFKK